MGKGVMKWKAYATVKSAFESGSRLCQKEGQEGCAVMSKEENGHFITVVYRTLEKNINTSFSEKNHIILFYHITNLIIHSAAFSL